MNLRPLVTGHRGFGPFISRRLPASTCSNAAQGARVAFIVRRLLALFSGGKRGALCPHRSRRKRRRRLDGPATPRLCRRGICGVSEGQRQPLVHDRRPGRTCTVAASNAPGIAVTDNREQIGGHPLVDADMVGDALAAGGTAPTRLHSRDGKTRGSSPIRDREAPCRIRSEAVRTNRPATDPVAGQRRLCSSGRGAVRRRERRFKSGLGD